MMRRDKMARLDAAVNANLMWRASTSSARILSLSKGVFSRYVVMPYMYILECADGSYYTGSAWDLERRFAQHQNGEGARHTAKRLPVKLVYCEYYDRIADAYYREKQVQGWSRKKKQALIEQYPEKLVEYSRNYTQYPPASTGSAPASTGSAPASTGSAPASTGSAPASTGSAPVGTSSAGATTSLDEPSSASGESPAAGPSPEPVEGDGDNLMESGYGE